MIIFIHRSGFCVRRFGGFRLFAVAFAALLFGLAGASAEPVEITVDPATGRDIGGYTEVQRIFGLMWGGNIPSRARPKVNRRIRALNINAGRAIFNGWVSQQPKTHAAWTDQKPRFDTWKESFEWWDRWITETDPDEFWMRRFNNPKRAGTFTSGAMGEEYELIAAAHLEIFDGRSARNPEAVGEHYAGIISGLKAHDGPPGIRVRFLQPCNEPNNPDYTGQFREDHDDPDSPIDMAAAVDAYTKAFNTAFEVVRREHPEVRLVGTCAGWMAPFYYGRSSPGDHGNWQNWAGRFIDGLEHPESIEYYNYHSYSTPVSQHLAIMGLTQNYAELQHDRRPRSVVTETNHFIGKDEITAEERRRQYQFHLEDLFMMLQRPDVFYMRTQFFAYDVEGQGTDLDMMVVSRDGRTVTPTSSYWPLWVMRDTRGTMLEYRNSSDDLEVFACSPREDRVVISVYNPSRQARSVKLDSGLEGGVESVRLRYAAWRDELSNCEHGERSLPARAEVGMEVPPLSVQNVTFEVNGTVEPRRKSRFRTHYGNRTQLTLERPRTLRIDAEDAGTPSSATLRLAFQHRKEKGQGTVILNGRRLEFDWADALPSRIEFHNWTPQEAGWIGIEIDPETVRDLNTLQVQPMEDQRLYFASLELHYER